MSLPFYTKGQVGCAYIYVHINLIYKDHVSIWLGQLKHILCETYFSLKLVTTNINTHFLHR